MTDNERAPSSVKDDYDRNQKPAELNESGEVTDREEPSQNGQKNERGTSRKRSRSSSGSRSSRSRSRSHNGNRRRNSPGPKYDRGGGFGSHPFALPSRCLGVFGMSIYTDERALYNAFNSYGPIESVQIVFDRVTGRSRGFAFVYFKHLEDAIKAKDNAVGREIDGQRVRIDFSVTKGPHPSYRDRERDDRYRDREYRRRSRSRSCSPRRYY